MDHVRGVGFDAEVPVPEEHLLINCWANEMNVGRQPGTARSQEGGGQRKAWRSDHYIKGAGVA